VHAWKRELVAGSVLAAKVGREFARTGRRAAARVRRKLMIAPQRLSVPQLRIGGEIGGLEANRPARFSSTDR